MNRFKSRDFVIIREFNTYKIAKVDEVVYENTHGWGILDDNSKSVIEKLYEPNNETEKVVFKYLLKVCKNSKLIIMGENELISINNLISLQIRFKK